MNPYIQSFQQPQDTSGLSPVYQNMAAQQQFQNQAAQQGQQLTQQAGQTAQGGMNPLAMAALLRKKDPNDPSNPNNMMGAGVPLPSSNVNPYGNMPSYNDNTYAGSGGNYGSGTGGFE
jgi:hypothetical protein